MSNRTSERPIARRALLLACCALALAGARPSRAASLPAAPAAAEASPAAAEESCVACHGTLPDSLGAPVADMRHDIHADKGISCADCHGGDPTRMDMSAMAPETGFHGKPTHEEIPAFCGRCHADAAYMRRFDPRLPTDQLPQYWTSVHGQRLKQGDQKVATCVSCHHAHGVLPPDHSQSPVFPANVPETCGHCHSNPQYMAEYKIPTDQEEKFKRSVHGEMLLVKRDSSAPACNDCHGNHGAFPPGATSIAAVCGQCHANNAALFTKSPHRPAFDRLGLPECVTCHGNHEIQHASDDMLGAQDGAVCARCHEPGSPGSRAAAQMHDATIRLKTVIAETRAMLTKASAMGMEVSDAQYTFRQDVEPQLIKVRTETHLADPGRVSAQVDEAIAAATASEAAARATLAEAWARRRNLLVPVGLIALLMLLLYAKLRQLERRDADEQREPPEPGRG